MSQYSLEQYLLSESTSSEYKLKERKRQKRTTIFFMTTTLNPTFLSYHIIPRHIINNDFNFPSNKSYSISI